MGTLILVRHGETHWNKEGRFQGQQDIPLSQEGIIQAETLANHLKSWRVDRIVSSDLERAYTTAQLIGKPHSLSVSTDPRLREFSFGVWEGLTRQQVKARYGQLFEERKANINTMIPGGETGSQMQARVKNWLEDILQGEEGQTIIAVSHGGTIRATLATILDVEIRKCYPLKLDNCGLSIIKWQLNSTKDIVFEIGFINYLPEIMLVK